MSKELRCTANVRVVQDHDNQGRARYRNEQCSAPGQEYELAGELTKVKAVLCGAHKYKADSEIAEHTKLKPTKQQAKLEKAGQQRLV